MKDKFSIIEGKILTEKSMKEREAGKYYFNVNPDASKGEIKRFIEEFFKTKVAKVNVLNLPRKAKSFKNKQGFRKLRTKAIVTLKEGEEIEEI